MLNNIWRFGRMFNVGYNGRRKIKKTFPETGIKTLDKINNYLTKILLIFTIKRQKGVLFLWIKNPDYYFIQNYVDWQYLLFDCDEVILRNSHKKFLYKEFLHRMSFLYCSHSGSKKINLKIIKRQNILNTVNQILRHTLVKSFS